MAAFVNGLRWGRVLNVRAYLRRRHGKWEPVRSHLRGWPRSREVIPNNFPR